MFDYYVLINLSHSFLVLCVFIVENLDYSYDGQTIPIYKPISQQLNHTECCLKKEVHLTFPILIFFDTLLRQKLFWNIAFHIAFFGAAK